MLMQNFKSAADLGITEPQLSALQKTLVLLETDKLRHIKEGDFEPTNRFVPTRDRTFSGEFNMESWSHAHKCGTVCCIGGTAEMIGNVEFDEERSTPNLYRLFYPQCSGISYASITTAQAATALRSYLTTGDARWDLAVA